MRNILFLLLLTLIVGCKSPYKKYYGKVVSKRAEIKQSNKLEYSQNIDLYKQYHTNYFETIKFTDIGVRELKMPFDFYNSTKAGDYVCVTLHSDIEKQ